PLNTWSCVASTYDGVNTKIYINKALMATQPGSDILDTATGSLTIGASMSPGETYDGRIDNVRLYNSDIGAAAVGNDCDTPIPAVAPPGTPITIKVAGGTTQKITRSHPTTIRTPH